MNFPTLSFAERDRRWARARELMGRVGASALIVFGTKSRERYEGYFSNEQIDGIVLLPIEGPAIYLLPMIGRFSRRMPENMQSHPFWITDYRVGATGAGVVAALRELGLDQSKIAVIGLDTRGALEPEGAVPYRTWERVLTELPKAEFVEVSAAFQTLMLQKSEEEIAVARFGAAIGEKACQAMLDTVKVGATDSDIYANVMHVLHSHRAVTVHPSLVMAFGSDDIGWSYPVWAYAGGAPRVMRPGDVIQAELLMAYGGIETQQQMTVGIEPLASVYGELEAIARRSYEDGLAVLKPGIRFGDLCDAMEAPIRNSDGWSNGPSIHTLAPHTFTGSHMINGDRNARVASLTKLKHIPANGTDTVLQSGMLFAFEPTVGKGNHRVHIGATVLLTDTGAEELNTIGTRVIRVN